MATDQGPIRVGIAGLGRSGWNIHARLLEPLVDKYRFVGVCDLIAARREEAEERLDCRSYERYEDMLLDKQVELVVVALPSQLHPSYTIQALQAGKHAISEKPMATRLADFDAMVAAAQKANRTLSAFQNRRYAQDFVQVKRVIDSGVLGRIVLIRLAWQSYGRRWDWQTLTKYSGGTLHNTCPHALDQVLQLYNGVIPEVSMHMERTLTLGDANDHIKFIFKAPNAPMIDLEVTSCCAYPQDDWLVMGTNGALSGNSRTLKWKYINPADQHPREVDVRSTPDRSYTREEYHWTEETWDIKESKDPGQVGYYLDLYETLRNGAPLAVTPSSIRPQVAILEAAWNQFHM